MTPGAADGYADAVVSSVDAGISGGGKEVGFIDFDHSAVFVGHGIPICAGGVDPQDRFEELAAPAERPAAHREPQLECGSGCQARELVVESSVLRDRVGVSAKSELGLRDETERECLRTGPVDGCTDAADVPAHTLIRAFRRRSDERTGRDAGKRASTKRKLRQFTVVVDVKEAGWERVAGFDFGVPERPVLRDFGTKEILVPHSRD